jgi:hypothetical protein
MSGDVIVRVVGDGNTVTLLCDPEQAASLREREQARADRQAAERSWARANPYRYAEGGTAAFEAAQDRQSLVFFGWLSVPVLAAIVWVFSATGLPDGFVLGLVTLMLGAALIAAIVVVPAAVVVAIPALIHALVLEHRDEGAARIRAAPREQVRRLAAETAENDRRLTELGIEI